MNSYNISLPTKGDSYMQCFGENLEEHPQCGCYGPLQS
jgi:hypothetical protein